MNRRILPLSSATLATLFALGVAAHAETGAAHHITTTLENQVGVLQQFYDGGRRTPSAVPVNAGVAPVTATQATPVADSDEEKGLTLDRATKFFIRQGLQAYATVYRAIKNSDRALQWHDYPNKYQQLMALEILRDDLRKNNLIETHQLDARYRQTDPATCKRWENARSPNGACTDGSDPDMGRAGVPFGRQNAIPVTGDPFGVNVPDPYQISRELMTRKEFKPAKIVNNTAMIWIQFETHDWVRHGHDYQRPLRIEGAPPGEGVAPSVERVGPNGPASRVSVNKVSHWWDASQVYGSSTEEQHRLRTFKDGEMKIDANGLLPIDPAVQDRQGRTGVDMIGDDGRGFWLGMSMMHTLFVKEHNSVAKMFKAKHPDWSDDDIFDKSRLVVAALIARIHTIEWTPAILQHPALQDGMEANWYGLGGVLARKLGKDPNIFKKSGLCEEFESEMRDVICGIVGSEQDHHGAGYSLTEQFDIVYRMHPLVPDTFDMYSANDGRFVRRYDLAEIQGADTRSSVMGSGGMANLWYSFGISHPGAIVLGNSPRGLQQFKPMNGPIQQGDLVALDIVRTRELGVPRYNQFRRDLRMPAFTSYLEMANGDAEMAAKLEKVYGPAPEGLEKVDTIVGMFAEKPPEGFGFSDTAFRIFILMASRRLKSDPFFTDKYNAETYTQEGLEWIETKSTMKQVLLRHYPELSASLGSVDNVFKNTWGKVGQSQQ
ncbi:MAG: peroxidase [Elusimicrobia bacterium]|nr:peroxidase [Elusimicrobiota bacterium]